MSLLYFVTCVTIICDIISHFCLSPKIKKSKIKLIKENKKRKKRKFITFFFFLPLSCMVASNRELANTLFPFILNLQSSLQVPTNTRNQQIDIKVNTPRSELMLFISNSSRELFVMT